MNKTNSKCFICKKRTDKIIVFSEETLQKYKNILKIRQDNNLHYSDVELPENVTQTDGYHSQCYRPFSALMKYQIEKTVGASPQPSTSSTGDSLICEDAKKTTSADETPPPPVNIENVETSQENAEIHTSLQHFEHSENKDATAINTNVCLFCTKSSKKWKGQNQKLCDLDVVSLKVAIEPFLSFVSDTEIFNKLQEVQESTILKAHRICRKEYINSLQSFVDKPQTTFHKNIQFHKEGFKNICQFINSNIISKKKCYFFVYLCDFYEGSIKDAARKYGHVYDNTLSKANFESKIKKHYEGQLKFSIFPNKKIVGPIDRVIDENLYSLLEEKSILHSAALILRQKIFEIEKQALPEEIKTEDLLKGECNIPETVKDFYLTVLAGSHSKRRKSFDSYRLKLKTRGFLIANHSARSSGPGSCQHASTSYLCRTYGSA
ncbi:Protein of unknown function [Cotesia congregata]|uniref:Uncharacterized protein n=1 Tax=Cotesia congregata TaxID=51543 RepID=A0A8J2E0R5_COTCN|nr:Protein of unknown function [Cotesia congregata]